MTLTRGHPNVQKRLPGDEPTLDEAAGEGYCTSERPQQQAPTGERARMDAVAAVRRLGGVATAEQIVALTSRRRLRTALRRGELGKVGRRAVALGDVHEHRRVAAELTAVCSHLSAAQHWGWPVKWPPDRAWVTVPRNRKVAPETRSRHHIVYADPQPDAIIDGVTSKLRTVIDCARRLAFDEALAVADSALRTGDVDRHDLIDAASQVRGPGAARVRRVAAAADERAANPFESVLRALVLEQPGLTVVPQLPLRARGRLYHPDLVDERRRVVIEADSHEFHSTKDAHARDCVRYTALVLAGWLVVRFTWEQVMLSPAYVHSVLADLVALPGAA